MNALSRYIEASSSTSTRNVRQRGRGRGRGGVGGLPQPPPYYHGPVPELDATATTTITTTQPPPPPSPTAAASAPAPGAAAEATTATTTKNNNNKDMAVSQFFSLNPLYHPVMNVKMREDIAVARYGRVYRRKRAGGAYKYCDVADKNNERWCVHCQKHLPLSFFYALSKRYMCRRHHALRVRQRVFEIMETDHNLTWVTRIYWTTQFASRRLGIRRRDVALDRKDMLGILAALKIPAYLRLVFLPVEIEKRSMQGDNIALLFLEDGMSIIDMFERCENAGVYTVQVLAHNLLPPNFDCTDTADPLKNKDYVRKIPAFAMHPSFTVAPENSGFRLFLEDVMRMEAIWASVVAKTFEYTKEEGIQLVRDLIVMGMNRSDKYMMKSAPCVRLFYFLVSDLKAKFDHIVKEDLSMGPSGGGKAFSSKKYDVRKEMSFADEDMDEMMMSTIDEEEAYAANNGGGGADYGANDDGEIASLLRGSSKFHDADDVGDDFDDGGDNAKTKRKRRKLGVKKERTKPVKKAAAAAQKANSDAPPVVEVKVEAEKQPTLESFFVSKNE